MIETILLVGGAAVLAWLLKKRLQNMTGRQNSTGQTLPPGTSPETQIQAGDQEVAQDRFVVFDDQANPVDTAFSKEEAVDKWKQQTDQDGTILDHSTGQNLTPEPELTKKIKNWLKRLLHLKQRRKVPSFGIVPSKTEPMSKAQLKQVKSLFHRPGLLPSEEWVEADEKLLASFVGKLNAMDLPVFNIAKKRREKCTKLVPIKRRKQMIRRKALQVPEEKTKLLTEVERTPSITPENDLDLRQIRNVSELKRVVPKTVIALPGAILGRRLAQHDLMVPQYIHEEASEKLITESSTKDVVVDEPYVLEYMDQMEVAEEPHGQLLYILVDGSGSMTLLPSHVAAALAIVVVGRNLDNASKYYYRVFDSDVKRKFTGQTPAEKRQLVTSISKYFNTGGGTNIKRALSVAADEILSVSKPDDQPEILLITDGRDYLSAEDIYEIIGDKVILHTVMVGAGNESLKAHSSTYVQLEPRESGEIQQTN